MKDDKFQARGNKWENEIISMPEAWDKEKIWVPNRMFVNSDVSYVTVRFVVR